MLFIFVEDRNKFWFEDDKDIDFFSFFKELKERG